jgi:hypothetical protein
MASGKVIHNLKAQAAGGAALALYARRWQSVPEETALEAFSDAVTPGPRPRGT